MTRSKRTLMRAFFMATTAGLAAPALAQPEPVAVPEPQEAEENAEIVVVGTQIRGSKITETLPVTVLDADGIDAIAASSGDELFRAIPQAGDVGFNEQRTTGGINDARGDVASINLRSLGTGNTLVLLNGRRMVLHPGYQTENLVPVTSVNANAIPVAGVRRLEVLRDGAAAIYGTDAVGGVVNTVLRDNFDGVTAEVQYGGSEGTSLREFSGNAALGHTFNQGRTNVSLFVDYLAREGMPASDRRYARNYDTRWLVDGTPFEGDTDFDNRSTNSPFGEFQLYGYTATVHQNGTAITSPSDYWHIQPDTIAGCLADLGNGLCADNSTQNSVNDEDRMYRYNLAHDRWIVGDTQRFNSFLFANHEFDSGLELFAEAGLYLSDYTTHREADAPLTAVDIIVPANNYWNPFGPTHFSDGSVNPNRLPGLDIPDEGVAMVLNDYRFVDAGPEVIEVKNTSYRLLAGLRGEVEGWNWESALLWSEAETEDKSNRISNTLLQQSLALETPMAYNVFNGGNLEDFSNGDTTRNDQAIIDAITVDAYRTNKSQLGLWDLRVSRPDLFALPAGDVGVAFGGEFRYEAFKDDRDERLDGTITFTNPVSGDISTSDLLGSSATPDSSGERDVASAYLEFAIPVISPSMEIPLVRAFEVQAAARFESYSDVGEILKPKVAAAWTVFPWLKFRGSYSEGFRAPNLVQINENGLERSNGRLDYVRCEADLRAGRIASLDDCGRSQSVVSQREGSDELGPETNDSYSLGVVFQPMIANNRFGRITATVDYWRINQRDVVGIFGDDNQIAYDYLLRTRGSSNPAVVRDTPTQEDIDNFAGTGLEPVGEILFVSDRYMNLLPRRIEGIDFTLLYELDDTAVGDFTLNVNAAHLLRFDQEPSPEAQEIIDAQAAGEIFQGFVVDGAEGLLRQDGNPRWRLSTSLTWRLGNFGAGVFGRYVSSVKDTGATLDDGTQWVVDDWAYANVYVQYTFDKGALDNTRLRLGVRNVTNEEPPLADSSFGYLGALHSSRGRYWYASIRKRF
ncbi:TonB-dependent receptor domain-containing protein [Pelagerythrobacter rhizovicinus]|uniref:TonB-dependent receptor n=1 Tax=Pelagerythrobacter rhizovicinus TaxID=2268576 RepID=A0A4V1QWJ9_9SPHN|nr:TonB-dependent receptor [Pelagerythrobacter rhizovicinus]RXZ66416.1 TonB-dependent receptor [Pelagerythrobacter rhizovicinus]